MPRSHNRKTIVTCACSTAVQCFRQSTSHPPRLVVTKAASTPGAAFVLPARQIKLGHYPDGNSATINEHLLVKVDWLGDKPADESSGYSINGTWQLSRLLTPLAGDDKETR